MDALREEVFSDKTQRSEVRKAPQNKKKFRKEWLCCWIVVALPFIGYIIFNAFPIGISIVSMFTDIFLRLRKRTEENL